MQLRGARKWKRALALSVTVAAIASLTVVTGGTAQSESAQWPDGRVSVLWPTFSELPGQSWDGSFRHCVPSPGVRHDYRCVYTDDAGRVGYVCVAAGDSRRDLSRTSVHAVVTPADPTYSAAAPAQVCFASLAYAMSLS